MNLIFPGDQKPIDKAQPRGAHAHGDLPGTGLGPGGLLKHEVLRWAVAVANQAFHGDSLNDSSGALGQETGVDPPLGLKHLMGA